ncbi:MAG: DUF3298 domain-containing protein [Oscillospiraceae bacterium]|nr:DUF3298 domain-containing protein [Oscillospiraceae bacterium]
MKRFFCLLLTGCLLLSGCSFVSLPPSETPTVEAPQEEPANPDALEFLHLSVGDSVLEESHGEQGYCRVVWDNLKLSDRDADKYPKLASTFQTLNTEAAKDGKALLFDLNSAREELLQWHDELSLDGEADIIPQRADNRAVSYLEAVYVYEGGAHPNYTYTGHTFDPNTGEEMKLEQVVTDPAVLPELLAGILHEKYQDVVFSDLSGTFSEYAPEDYSWTIDYQGITFWFSPYEIAAYAAGLLSAKVFFADSPELFPQELTQAPSAYALEILTDHEMEFFFDGKTTVHSGTMPDPYGSYEMLSVDVNGAHYVDEINYAYSFDKYLVCMGNDLYLYVTSYSDGDYNEFVALKLGDTISEIARLRHTQPDSEAVGDSAEDFVVYRPFLNDPNAISLSTTLQLLGTRQGVANYKVGGGGVPEMTDRALSLEGGNSVTSKLPLKVLLLPEEEETEIPSGTEFSPLRTDGKSYVEARLPDGKEVRLTVDTSGYPVKVGGIPEEECFENLLYAG